MTPEDPNATIWWCYSDEAHPMRSWCVGWEVAGGCFQQPSAAHSASLILVNEARQGKLDFISQQSVTPLQAGGKRAGLACDRRLSQHQR
jgi:hypothetical protein